MAKIKALGFGFDPEETQHHFLVLIPNSHNGHVTVYERFTWDNSTEQVSDIDELRLKVSITKKKWEAVKDYLQQEFNKRLKDRNVTVGKFKTGQTPIDRLFGKELILLLWAIEDSDPGLIPAALKNWFGLSKEERWWLFTMTNAVTGSAEDKRGWRIAIRYALTENPVNDPIKQGNILEYLYKNV